MRPGARKRTQIIGATDYGQGGTKFFFFVYVDETPMDIMANLEKALLVFLVVIWGERIAYQPTDHYVIICFFSCACLPARIRRVPK